jgi:signal transduction histidine kinase
MQKPQLTINIRLLLIVGVLNILIAALLANGVYESWINFRGAQQLKLGSIIIDDLYKANKTLSLERASTLAAIYTPPETITFLHDELMKDRLDVDKALNSTFTHLKSDSQKLFYSTEKIKEKHHDLLNQRAKIDFALAIPIAQRELMTANQYFNSSSSLVIEIQHFILTYSRRLQNVDATINQQMMFKYFVWDMAEYIGKEYAIIGQIISESKSPTIEQQELLASLSGNIEYGWEILRNFSTNDDIANKLLPHIEEANTHYFFTIEQINELFNSKQTPNTTTSYPISAEMWLGMSEQAVDSLLALQDKILEETRLHVDQMENQAQQKIFISAFIFVGALILSIYCWHMIVFRITRPINTMVNTLYKATHEQSLEIPEMHYHYDEIGKLAHVLEVFKNNSNKIKQSNEELERFAFIAAHDLKTPLRAVYTISEWLEEDLNNLLPDKSKKHLNELRNRVKLMDKLLDDTLEYARIDAKMKHSTDEITNGKNLIAEIITLLKPPSGFTINTSKSLSSTRLSKFPLQQILYNLIHNAIAHHDKEQGIINIEFNETEAEYIFHVNDDGPGIDPRYHHKIFEMFQTLQPRDKSKGRGMGLAIVRKIITNHGGSITLESESGQGASFCFTWPKSKKEPAGEDHANVWREYA